MATNQELREQINQKQAEISALERQIQQQTPADGTWNPADYLKNRYGKTDNIAGKNFNSNFSKIPEEAQKYIQDEIYKRQQSGYPVTQEFLNMLQSKVNSRWFDEVPKNARGKPNWDISAFWSTNKGMAKALNKNKTFSYGERPQNNIQQPAVQKSNEQEQSSGQPAPERTAHEQEKFNEYKDRYGPKEQEEVPTSQEHLDKKFNEYKERYTQPEQVEHSDVQRGILDSKAKDEARTRAENTALNTIIENPERANEIRRGEQQAEKELRDRTADHSLDADQADYKYTSNTPVMQNTEPKKEAPKTETQTPKKEMPVFEQKSDDFEIPKTNAQTSATQTSATQSSSPTFTYSANGPSNAMDAALDLSIPGQTPENSAPINYNEVSKLVNQINDDLDRAQGLRYLERVRSDQGKLTGTLGKDERDDLQQDLAIYKKALEDLLKEYGLL